MPMMGRTEPAIIVGLLVTGLIIYYIEVTLHYAGIFCLHTMPADEINKCATVISLCGHY